MDNQLIVSAPDEEALKALLSEEQRSPVINIEFSQEVKDFEATICLFTQLKEGESSKDFCLAFFDAAKERWYCQDENLTQAPTTGKIERSLAVFNRNQHSSKSHQSRDLSSSSTSSTTVPLCGVSTHFTNFAILLGGAADGQKSEDAYITKSWRGDVGLTVGVCSVAVIVVVVVVAIHSVGVAVDKRKSLNTRTTRISDFSMGLDSSPLRPLSSTMSSQTF